MTRSLWTMGAAGLVWLVAAAGCTSGIATTGPRFYDIENGRVLQGDRVLPQLRQQRIILVGEHHTVSGHHQAQLAVIRMLNEAGARVAVGLEMFRGESQPDLDRWVAGAVDEAAFQAVYRDNWTYDWSLYADIFRYARDHGVPLVGLNVPREITRQVARGGFASLEDGQKQRLGDVVCRVDKKYMDFIRGAYGGHGHGEMSFLYFCEAQMVWDNAMAVQALAYLDANPDRMMVMLTGTGHASKQAVPSQIRRRSDIAVKVILPEAPGSIDRNTVGPEDADYLVSIHQ